MRAVSILARGVGASVLVAGLLVGVPILLVVVAGNPLPTRMPNWSNVYWATRQGHITSTFVIKGLACVVWLAWSQLAWAMVWEIAVNMPTVASGRRRRATPLTFAPASRFAHQLVSAVLLVTAISSASSPAIAEAPSLRMLVSPHGSNEAPAAAMVLTDADATTVATAAGTGTSTYRVLGGDTLWDVAERCLGDGAHVDAIVACNPHLSTSRRLRGGQIIELPAHAHMPQADTDADGHTATSAEHVVVAGDTLWDIVEDHYGTADRSLVVAVAEHNSISDPSLIYPGDVVAFPAGLSAAPRVVSTGADKHVVVEGDTLWGILEDHYGTVDNDLVRAVVETNGLETPSLIFPGQQIVLPHDPRHPAPESAPTTPAAVDEEPPEAGTDDAPAAERTTEPTEREVDEPVSPIDHPAASAPSNTSAPQEPPVATPSQPTNHEADRPVSSTPVVTPAPGAAVQRKVDRALPNEQDVEDATSKSPEVVAGSRSDLVSARWLFGSAAVTALGLAGAWATLKRLRNRRRRWLDLPDTPSHASPSPLAEEARTQRSIAAVAELVATGRQPSPAALGAVLAGDEITVLFDEPRPEPAPGWESADVGWRRPWGDMAGTPAVFSPGLVTLGATDGGGEILLDLSAVGSVSVRGDGGAVEQLMCSMLWELASQPLDAGVDLHVVGLACAASHMTSSPGKLIDLTTALEVASKPIRTDERLQVFLVDPFGEDSNSALLNPLVAACERGSGRAVVVAGACEKPGEEVFVPTTVRATWRGHSLRPPQLPADVDRQLAATLAAVVVGRRNETTVGASSQVFDPEAEAASLRSVALLTEHDESLPPATGGQWDGINDQPGGEVGANGRDDDVVADLRARSDAPSEMPDVLLRTTGRQVEIVGLAEPVSSKAELAVAFLLAAAGRELHGSEISGLTGYSIKTLHNSVTAAHPLVDRTNGVMKLREGSWTDHGWATECVRRLAAAIDASDAAAEERWLRSGFDVLHAVEQGPFAVLPTKDRNRRNGVAPWDWVDEYPEDVSARDRAETDLAEAGLAYAELWCSLPVAELVRPTELVSVLCRLAMVVPYAAVTRQVHTSTWSSGAECLLEMAMRVADTDVTLQQRVQRTARVMVARQQLEATDDLADALGL